MSHRRFLGSILLFDKGIDTKCSQQGQATTNQAIQIFCKQYLYYCINIIDNHFLSHSPVLLLKVFHRLYFAMLVMRSSSIKQPDGVAILSPFISYINKIMDQYAAYCDLVLVCNGYHVMWGGQIFHNYTTLPWLLPLIPVSISSSVQCR